MDKLPVSNRSRLRRMHHLGSFDRETIYATLDAQPICSVGYVIDGEPYVTPTLQWREGDRVYWHGSSASHALRHCMGHEVCLNVTIVDGFIMARSGFNQSINPRSVTLIGTADLVPETEKARHMGSLIEGLWPGRTAMLRPMRPQEVKATTLLSLPIMEGSAEVRSGQAEDEAEDYALPTWAGVIPVTQTYGTPLSDPCNLQDVAVPEHILNFSGRR